MNIFFNELSFRPYHQDINHLKISLKKFIQLVKELKDTYPKIKICITENFSQLNVLENTLFFDFLNNLERTQKDLILSILGKPYLEENLQLPQLLNNFFFENKELDIEQVYCYGLSSSYLNNSFTLSLDSHTYWQNEKIVINEQANLSNLINELIVTNLFQFNDLAKKIVGKYIPIQLKESKIPPEKK